MLALRLRIYRDLDVGQGVFAELVVRRDPGIAEPLLRQKIAGAKHPLERVGGLRIQDGGRKRGHRTIIHPAWSSRPGG